MTAPITYDLEQLRAIARRAFIGEPTLNINALDPYDHRTEQYDHLELETNESGVVIEVYEPHKQRGL